MGSEQSTASSPGSAVDWAAEQEYNLRLRHPERSAVYDRFALASAALRQDERTFSALRYGDSANGIVDFFSADVTAPAPLFVFIHGGYWRALDRSIFSFLARPWLERGVHVALPGYDLVPAASVGEIAGQVDSALDWLLRNAGRLRVDPGRVLVSGHSAGAHLGALALSRRTDWSAKGFMGISGVYDLLPLLATTVNRDIRLDAAQAQSLSPQRLRVDPAPRYVCAVGGAETEGFRRQSRDYAAMLRARGCDAEFMEVPGRTHFDVLDDLADVDAPLFRKAHALLS